MDVVLGVAAVERQKSGEEATSSGPRTVAWDEQAAETVEMDTEGATVKEDRGLAPS